MAGVRIFTLAACPFCVRAKQLLDTKGCAYAEVDVTSDPRERLQACERSGHATFPQIYIGEDFVGGYEELSRLDREGRLDAMLY